ncbi:MAG: amidase [Thermomicrobiales bacterium]|nr:amidase [Thermomicrobiales bacterium]
MAANEICFMDAVELRDKIAGKELSAREVMSAFLGQIEKVNPAINAIVSKLDDDAALKLADDADDVLARKGPVGPLHGLPHAVKDLADAAGFPTTKGSPLHKDDYPAQDCAIVERIRGAGSLIIGKTNVPEFGLGSHSFNPIFGATKNPYDQTKSAGGSSGGAGAALATGMLPLADGSDSGGSLRNPGNFNNVVGFRVSPGLVPAWPGSHPWIGIGVKGPMARTVRDTALLLSVMAGADGRDQLAYPSDASSFTQPLDRDFKGVRVAWSPDLGELPLDPRVRSTLAKQRATFEALGCIVEDVAPPLWDADEIFHDLRAGMLAAGNAENFARDRDQMKPEAVWNIEKGLAMSAAQLGQAMARQEALFQRMREFMETYEFVLCAVNQVPPFPAEWRYPEEVDGVPMENYIAWMKTAYYITVTRCPSISVPAGFTDDGLPVGLQIAGRFRDDLSVLQMAHAFEQATGFGKVRPAIAG